jgi:signal transduction histidine kinase
MWLINFFVALTVTLVPLLVLAAFAWHLIGRQAVGPLTSGGWDVGQVELAAFVALSILLILIAIYQGTTKQVTRLYQADLHRAAVLREVVYTNKLAAIGRLASGVAHEINNPSAIIYEKTGLIKDLLQLGPERMDQAKMLTLCDGCLEAVKRVREITHRLLSFARHQPVTIEPLEPAALINDVLLFMGKEISSRDLKAAVEQEPGLPAIQSDRSLLEQVFLNIINNAFTVLADGGRLDISLARTKEGIRVVFADNGPGIASEHLGHIFEPFFTTRGEQGIGLGLSITYGIVHKLGGNITVESQQGRGTTFTITLPLVCPAEASQGSRADIGRRAFAASGGGDEPTPADRSWEAV